MQQDIDLLYKRSRSWGLDFSVNKCVYLHFGRSPLNPFIHNSFLGDAAIPISEFCRDLGVLVDTSLKFYLHVQEIYNKKTVVYPSPF